VGLAAAFLAAEVDLFIPSAARAGAPISPVSFFGSRLFILAQASPIAPSPQQLLRRDRGPCPPYVHRRKGPTARHSRSRGSHAAMVHRNPRLQIDMQEHRSWAFVGTVHHLYLSKQLRAHGLTKWPNPVVNIVRRTEPIRDTSFGWRAPPAFDNIRSCHIASIRTDDFMECCRAWTPGVPAASAPRPCRVPRRFRPCRPVGHCQ
jgi:hypothetical protein